ncbi:MAG: hypothetical protein Q8P67_07205 [archaeon]|nr:hypothetical protein [archaeon]
MAMRFQESISPVANMETSRASAVLVSLASRRIVLTVRPSPEACNPTTVGCQPSRDLSKDNAASIRLCCHACPNDSHT